jgi:hypothetical protein
MAFGIANCILSFANGNIEYLLGNLDGITRTFGHEASMPQPLPFMALKSKLRHYPKTLTLDTYQPSHRSR